MNELSIAFSSLYKTYCEALGDPNNVSNESNKRIRFSHFQPQITPALNQIFKISSQPSEINNLKEPKRKGGSKKFDGFDSFEHLDFHMSTSAKYLLLSAFLASRNPATLDASLFDSTGGPSSRKSKKRYFNLFIHMNFHMQLAVKKKELNYAGYLLFVVTLRVRIICEFFTP